MTITYINLTLLLILLLYIFSFYKKGLEQKKSLEHSFATLDVYLKRRYDLLVYVFENMKYVFRNDEDFIAKIRTLLRYNYEVLERYEKLELNEKIASIIKIIISEAQNSEKLQNDEGFLKFIKKEDNLEDVIEKTRKEYNSAVKKYNSYVEPLPRCLIAQLFKFNPERLYENSYSKAKHSV